MGNLIPHIIKVLSLLPRFFLPPRNMVRMEWALLCILAFPLPAFSFAKPPPANTTITLRPLVTQGLERPVLLTHAGDHRERLFIVEQAGKILIWEKKRLQSTPFLDISDRITFGGEQGLLGVAFHPQFPKNGRMFVNYSRKNDGATVISEFQTSGALNQVTSKERIILVIPQPYSNHNGGMIAFGPGGFLYIATGDGGAGGDPGNRGQNQKELLGKILRIDIDQDAPYAIPKTNPFSARQHGQEIFAWGLRNPWRFSFDKDTGALWAADVGQNQWEEINQVKIGKNYGWRIMEGLHCFKPSNGCQTNGLSLPIAEYAHESGRCSITGGYVYRGRHVPHLQGTYIFGDYCSGEIMGLVNNQVTVLFSSRLRISSFGEDEDRELYVVDHGGGIYRITDSSQTK